MFVVFAKWLQAYVSQIAIIAPVLNLNLFVSPSWNVARRLKTSYETQAYVGAPPLLLERKLNCCGSQ